MEDRREGLMGWGIEGFGEAADIRFGTTTVYLQGHLPGHQRETEAEDGDVFPPLPRKCWVHLGSSWLSIKLSIRRQWDFFFKPDFPNILM